MPKQNKKNLYTTCSELVFIWIRSHKSMNNLLSYCGLTHARMNPSKKISTCTDQYLFCVNQTLALPQRWDDKQKAKQCTKPSNLSFAFNYVKNC